MSSNPTEPLWLDTGDFLKHVSASMNIGQLLHDKVFSLEQSMQAIEIGVPKMDVGMNRDPLSKTAEQLIADGAAPVSPPPSHLLAILDSLLAAEATWHTGSLLPLTIYSSLYMTHIDHFKENPILFAYCQALHVTVSFILHTVIMAGRVCDEEDFNIMTFGLNISEPSIEKVNQTIEALEKVENELAVQKKQRNSSGSGGGGGKAQKKNSSNNSNSSKTTLDMNDAIISRLKYRRCFLLALLGSLATDEDSVVKAAQAASDALEQLTIIKATAHLADQYQLTTTTTTTLVSIEDEGTEDRRQSFSKAPRDSLPLVAFYPHLGISMMGIAPPRPSTLLDLPSTIQCHTGTLTGIHEWLPRVAEIRNCWRQLKQCLVEFSAQDESAIVRSVVLVLLTRPVQQLHQQGEGNNTAVVVGIDGGGDDGRKQEVDGTAPATINKCNKPPPPPPTTQVVPEWCPGHLMVRKALLLPATGDPTQDSKPGPEVDLFIDQCTIAFQGWVHACCSNRCRQQRRHRKLLEDWRNMVDHAWNADFSVPFRTWALEEARYMLPTAVADMSQQHGGDDGEELGGDEGNHHHHQQQEMQFKEGDTVLTSMMEIEASSGAALHLMLGFPLQLVHSTAELSSVYWYCGHLFHWALNAKVLVSNVVPQRPQSEQVQETVDVMVLRLNQAMCLGMFNLSLAIDLLDKKEEEKEEKKVETGGDDNGNVNASSSASFSTAKEQYLQRFGCLRVLIRPGFVSYEQYLEATKQLQDDEDGNGAQTSSLLSLDEILGASQVNFEMASQGSKYLLGLASQKGSAGAVSLLPTQKEEIEAVGKIAMQNMLASKILRALLEKGDAVVVSWDWSLSMKHGRLGWYPVAGVKRRERGSR
jgi:hypothetical protein